MQNIVTNALKLGLWSSLDIHFANMLTFTISSNNEKQQYKKNALILAIASLSSYVHRGHTCLPLSMLTFNKLFHGNYLELAHEIHKKSGKLSTENWQELLLSSSIVSDGSHLSPLILENKCLYLYRMWKDECTIAKFFNSKNNHYSFQEEKIFEILNQLFPKMSTDIDWEKIATAVSLIKQKSIISGGPGTGKTFIIAKIITAFLLLYHNAPNIKMIAPTGKAAHHLTESFNIAIKNTIIYLNNKLQCMLPKKATTIHNFLGTQLYKKSIIQYDYFFKHFFHVDLLIIDESSMVSLSILAQLILILPKYTKIIFLGDHNQLCSVGPGSVFKDICQYANFNYSFQHCKKIVELTGYTLSSIIRRPKLSTQHNHHHIVDSTCILKKNYRFSEQSGIHQLSTAINLGNSDRVLSLLTSSTYTDISYISYKKNKDYINMITDCAIKYCHYLQIFQQNTLISIIDALKIFNQYRILCALNDGPFGVITINYYIEQILQQKGLIQIHKSTNYIGRPIIILRNSPSLELFNGDTGILLLNSKEKLSACFLYPKNIIKIIPIYQLPKYETCFAITIHKSQGSEFQNVVIILPDQHIPILTRELFYTAVTRARQKLMLYTTNHVIINSINLVTKRYSGLYNRIKDDYNL